MATTPETCGIFSRLDGEIDKTATPRLSPRSLLPLLLSVFAFVALGQEYVRQSAQAYEAAYEARLAKALAKKTAALVGSSSISSI